VFSSIYLHETKIPTYHFQDSLPKLGIPKLEDTLKKYEYSASPLVSAEELQVTKKAIASFLNGEGPKLQEELIALDKQRYSSFYNAMWFDMYLESRAPLPLNFNPQLTFKMDENESKNEQAVRATNLVSSSLRFYRTLLDEKLIPDIFHTEPKKSETPLYENLCRFSPRKFAFYTSYFFGAYPLDMSQYQGLFSSTRIPHPGKDELRKATPQQSKHIVVQRDTSFYTVQVLNDDLSPIPADAIERAFRSILQDSESSKSEPVGLLSGMERDAWARTRDQMEQSPLNKASLEAIDTALFAVCLEGDSPVTYQDISSSMLHGNGRNRWFDKSFQLIVAGNGTSAVNFEHAWGDGVAVLRYFNEVYKDSKAVAPRDKVTDRIPAISSSPSSAGVPVRLGFELDSNIRSTIEKAGNDFDSVVSSLELATMETDIVGKELLKKKKIGADGFMQMAFQLAHQRMKGYTPSTYESASTAAFKHGRTETIRSATPEAKQFALAFCDSSVSKEDRAALLLKAIKNHGSLTKDGLMGKGMDRHLFALKNLAQKNARALPELYTDKSYQVLSKIILSTSTLSSDALYAGGFGPVNDECFALAYGIEDNAARTAIATYKLGSDEFAHHLEKSLKDMRDAVCK